MKILHRIRGETGKRCLSFLLAFAMLVGLMSELLPKAAAATGGITSLNVEVLSDGSVRVWGSGIPLKAGCAEDDVGINSVNYKYTYKNVERVIYQQKFVKRSFVWTSSAHTAYTFDANFFPSVSGSLNDVWINIYDRSADKTNYFQTELGRSVSNVKALPIEQATIPAIPNLQSPTPGDGKFSVRYRIIWDGGRPVESHKLLYGLKKEGTFPNSILLRNGLSITGQYPEVAEITGLTNFEEYQYKFEVTNEVGTRTSSTYTFTPGMPDAPTNVRIIPGNQSATITWDAPTELRGSTLTGYSIYASAAAINPIGKVGNPSTRQYVITGLENGKRLYQFARGIQVAAVTAKGEGTRSSETAHPIIGSPIPPNAPTLSKTSGSRNVKITTTAPSNNGATITQYNIYVNGSLKKSVSGATLNATLDVKNDLGLADNTAYNISVSATNSRGEGPVSAATSFTTNGPPAKPTLSSAEATKVTGQAKLTWTTPANNGGPITAVQILQNGSVVKTLSAAGTPNEWQAGKMDTPGQVSTNFVTGLKDGTSYSFQVRAVNAYGQGTLSDAKSAMPYRIPDAPGGLKVTRGVRSLTLNWSAAANGGNAVSKYNVLNL